MLECNDSQNVICCCIVTKSCLTLCDPWTITHQDPVSMGFPRQAYWNGLPFPSPGDLPYRDQNWVSWIARRFFSTVHWGSPSDSQNRRLQIYSRNLPNQLLHIQICRTKIAFEVQTLSLGASWSGLYKEWWLDKIIMLPVICFVK